MTKFLTFDATNKLFEEIEESGGGGGGGTPEETFSCDASVAVGDFVYVTTSTNTVEKAFAGTPSQTPDGIGFVVSKSTSTSCTVRYGGKSGSIFSGLTAGDSQWASTSTAGGIQSTPPNTNGQKIQEVGFAISSTEIFIVIEPTTLIL